MKKRVQFIIPATVSIMLAFVVMTILNEMQPGLSALAEQTGALFGLGDQIAGADSGSLLWNFIYSFTDLSEGPFVTDTLATVFIFGFGILSYWLEKIKSPYAGTGVGGMGYKWVWLVTCQMIGMILANVFWRLIVGWQGWIPTFTPLVSVTPIAILCFGKPNVKKAATGIVIGALLPVALSQLLMVKVTIPLGLPGFVAIGVGMSVSTALATELFHKLPWMNEDPDVPVEDDGAPAIQEYIVKVKQSAGYLTWTRVFGGDLSELYFWSSSLSGFGIFIGCFISFLLNPGANGFGTLLPEMLFAFVFVSAIGMVIWGPRYQEKGFAVTFEGVLIAGVLVSAFPAWHLAIPTMIVCAIVGPAVIHWTMGVKLFQRWHLCVSVQFFAAVIACIGALILKAVA